ncbi:MAG: TraR/DksA C4-type zinc finger protein [Pseudomonadota bacterium]|nr:TraR/DksA C4-type zinc finger protein [Pseudomonadota bacterium]MEE3100980.1 TraR/DksA C4-type zinc finger protein [Pseudomonadota bacterium]
MKPVSHYQTLLETRLAELEGRLRRIDEDLDQGRPSDFEEQATAAENDEVLESLGETGLQEIRGVRAALDRVAQGTFGDCVNCGEKIAEARLDLVPHAAVCASCAAAAG